MLENATNLKKEIEKWLEVLHLFEKYVRMPKNDSDFDFSVKELVELEVGMFLYDYGARSFFVQNGNIFFRDNDFMNIKQLEQNRKFTDLCTSAIETGDERLFKYIAIGLIKKNIMIVEEQRYSQRLLDDTYWKKKAIPKPQWKDTGMVLYDGHLAGEGEKLLEESYIKRGGTAKAETAKQKSRLEYNMKRIKNQGGFIDYGKQKTFNGKRCYFSLPDGSGLFRRRSKEGPSDVRSGD